MKRVCQMSPAVSAALSLTLVLALIMTGLLASPGARAEKAFDSGRLSFSVTVSDRLTPYHTMIANVMPGKPLDINLTENHLRENFSISASAGKFAPRGRRGWRWEAPDKPGYYPLQITRKDSKETMSLQVFVLVPATQVRDGRLNGYRIGHYPEKPFRGLAAYEAPKGFIEVTADNVKTSVSPHFRLGQFLSKQQSSYPKYLVLSPRLLSKLELLLEDVNAADIYIDEGKPRGMMDDLNKDGASDRKDAAILYDLAQDLPLRHGRPELIGGLGEYDARLTDQAFLFLRLVRSEYHVYSVSILGHIPDVVNLCIWYRESGENPELTRSGIGEQAWQRDTG